MQRLIDVNAMLAKHCIALKGPNDGEHNSCSGCLGEPHGYCCMEMKGDEIYNEPTVDAIPVEWLEKKLDTLCFEAMGRVGTVYGDRIGELAKSINEVMKLWQQEQEAR